jgi:hypothetical protein
VGEARLRTMIAAGLGEGWRAGRTCRVDSGFYQSQALEVRRA